MTKAELVAEVVRLEGEVARLSPGAEVVEHLARLEAGLAPYLRRLARLPEAERAVEEAVELEDVKAALMRLGALRLDSREVGAMNNLLRQIAEVKGLLVARRPLAGRGRDLEGVEDGPQAGKGGRAGRPGRAVDMDVLSNVVRLGRKRA